MAGMPAYRYDYATSAPARQYPQTTPKNNPSVRVVRGRKSISNPSISDSTVTLVKVGIVLMIVFLVIGFVRVGLASAAYSTASASSSLQTEIADARSMSDSLAVQKSLISSPSNLRAEAQKTLNMAAPTETTTMVLPVDVVATDSNGNLSLAQSVAQTALVQG